MRLCEKCGKELKDYEVTCPACGMEYIKCPHCGAIVTAPAEYCTACGKSLKPITPQNTPEPKKGQFKMRIGSALKASAEKTVDSNETKGTAYYKSGEKNEDPGRRQEEIEKNPLDEGERIRSESIMQIGEKSKSAETTAQDSRVFEQEVSANTWNMQSAEINDQQISAQPKQENTGDLNIYFESAAEKARWKEYLKINKKEYDEKKAQKRTRR